MRKLVVSVPFLILCMGSLAQRFGGTPPSVKWKQINTDAARVIFPQGLDSQAQRIASLIYSQATLNPVPLGKRSKKINIVLQNQPVLANGYVGLGPYRSEFYLTPSLNNFDQGSLSWAGLLAVHEYRHVQQFNNFNNGISKLMHVLFGEEGYSLAINASVPDWFFEGDAVYHETVLSQQGRGRLPLFLNAYPSLWKANKKYSWMKLRNGSFKDYVPDHYNLGYLLVNYGYEKYGLDFWSKVTRDASAFNGLFYPFQKAIRKYSKVDYKTFRNEAFDYYKDLTQTISKGEGSKEPAAKTIFPVNKHFVNNYLYAYSVSPDSLLYLKTTYRHRPSFFIKDATGEHRLRVKDIALDDQYSYRNGKIVYAAYENDPRWRWREYSVLKVLDIQTGHQKKLTRRSKYFSPDISGSGNKVAAIEMNENGKSELHILNANSGEVINRIDAGGVNTFTDPKFIGEDSVVTAVRLYDGRMALAITELKTGSTTRLTPPSFNVVGNPSVTNNIVYFNASYGGSDNVFALKLADLKIYRVTSNALGNYFVNAANGKITWSAFTAEGYQLKQMDETPITGEPVDNAVTDKLTEPFAVGHAAGIPLILTDTIANRKFPVSNYRKSTRLLNFHSWRPYYEDPEFSFSLYGENVLNTLQTQLYYLYNENDKTNAVGLSAIYGGLYPYIDLGTEYTFDRNQVINNKLRSWDQVDLSVGLSIPLRFNSGRTFKTFTVGTDYVYRSDMIKGASKLNFLNSNFSYLLHHISFSEQIETAVQHIYPRFGYSLSAQHRHAITNYKSWQFLGGAALYLPGFFSTHSIVLTGGFQETDTANVLFGNRIAYSRGYNEAYFARMLRGSVNYHFPLLYPDWGFGNMLYFQRIRANGFYDHMKVFSNDKNTTAEQRSAGGEVYFDTKWWNQYELTFGFRVSRLLDKDFYTGGKGTVYEFILPVSIFPR